MSGNLPPGVTDRDIDRAAPGYWEEPFYCVLKAIHCAVMGLEQCDSCQRKSQQQEPNDDS